MEEWKDIPGCDGLFQVSNEGKIKRVEVEIVTKTGVKQTYREKLYQFWVAQDGYARVHLPRRFHKTALLHKLVAETFIPVPDELKQYIGTQNLQVNHKNENKLDNNAENLEWCTAKYNSNYGTRNDRMGSKLKGRRPSDNTIKASVERCSRKVSKYSMNGELIETYSSLAEAERQNEGVHHANIVRCCNGSGRLKSTGGFKWKYAD